MSDAYRPEAGRPAAPASGRQRAADPLALAGRVAMVTGAGSRSSGIGNGRAISVVLARAGARVALVDLDPGSARETLELIEQEGGAAEVFAADVSRPQPARALFESVAERFGRLDILVNNVGILGPVGDLLTIDPDEWDRVMRINVTSMLIATQCAVPRLQAVGGGSVVNISSIAGLVGTGAPTAYAASKAAVIGLTRNLAGQLGKLNIRVNCVAPGAVYTPMVAARLSPEAREGRRLANPLRQEGTAWDVAQAVAFLVSDAARWITGVVLPVDGGFTAVAPTPLPTERPVDQPSANG